MNHARGGAPTIDVALVMLNPNPELSDSDMETPLHRQMDGGMPSDMGADAVNTVVRDAVAEARKSIKSKG